MDKKLRILIVEDNADDVLFIVHHLKRAGYEVTHERVETEATFTNALESKEWDAVLADYSLPQFGAMAALGLLQKSRIDLPFIIVSGAIGEEVAVASMKSGAHDYVLKGSLARLVPVIERELREAQVRRERKRAEEAYRRLASLVEFSGDAIIGKTLDGIVTSWNRGAEKIFGYTEEEAKGRSVTLIIPPDRSEEEAAILEQLKRREAIPPFETVRMRKDGRRIDVSVTVSPIADANGNIVGASKIARDITERKRAENYMAALSKLGQSLSSASTPLEAARIISTMAEDLFSLDAFTLDLYSADTGQIQTVLNVDSIDGQKREVPSTYPDGNPSSIARRIIENGAELILRDRTNIEMPSSIPFGDISRRSASLMFVPIRKQEKVIGILSVQSYQIGAYEQRDLNALQTLADYCGGALERMQVREELRSTEQRFRRVVESNMIGIFFWDADGRIFEANDRFLSMVGFTREDLEAGRVNWSKMTPAELESLDRKCLEVFTATGVCEPYEKEYIRKDGVRIPVLVGAASLGKGGENGVAFVLDISERKQSEEALRKSEERYRKLAESAPIGIFENDAQGREIYSNARWAAISELKRGESIGFGWMKVIHPEDREAVEHSWRRMVDAGNEWASEHRVLTPTGVVHWVRAQAAPILSRDGKCSGFVGTVADITERKRSEEELTKSREELRALAAHLQSIREEERKHITREIHDELGQSLTGFKMDLTWIRNRLQAGDGEGGRHALIEKIGVMGKSIDETANLVRKLCTELRPGVLDDLGLTAAIEWQIREYEKRTGIRCSTNVETGDLGVDAERSTALFRIFQELLTNVARHARASRVEVGLKRAGSEILLEVRDNGRGIKENEKAGTKSLGIVGMRERALVLGGQVEISGEPGKGTMVRVRVPLTGMERSPGWPTTEKSVGHKLAKQTNNNHSFKNVIE
jgi:PAS domain S-box-containing protein